MNRLWQWRGLNGRQIASRIRANISSDDVLGQSAKLSFYFLLGLFPLLLALTNLFGLFAQGRELRADLLNYFQTIVPHSAFQLIVDTLNQVTAGASGGKLTTGLLAAMWAGASGMTAIAEGVNRAHRITDRRPWWKLQLTTMLLTLAFAVFTVTAVLLILGGGRIGTMIASRFGLEQVFEILWNLGRWIVALFFVLIAISLIYRFAPDTEHWRWKWVTPGSFIAVGSWLAASFGFRMYLRFFNSYNTTYGSLGAVIILLLWFYLTGAAILVGAEVNAEVERALARAGRTEPPPEKTRHAGES